MRKATAGIWARMRLEQAGSRRSKAGGAPRSGLGKKEILRRVAPLDDGQVRVGGWTVRLGEAGRFMAALTKGWRSGDRRYNN
jgi:hypothetical protein